MIETILAFVFGLLIGSFVNVCVYRWTRDLSMVRPRSFCPSCKAMIQWYDNIPLVSYALLRGRCRKCSAPIRLRYPAVELLTGFFFAYAVFRFGVSPAAAKAAIFSAILVGLIAADLEEKLLPDGFTLGGLVTGIVIARFELLSPGLARWVAPWGQDPRFLSVIGSIAGAALPSFLLWAVGEIYFRVRKREGLGLGDVKMLAMIGAFVGLPGALLTLVLASLTGAVLGVVYIAAARKSAATYQLPFGVFLGVAALTVANFGEAILAWYYALGT